MFEIQTNVSFLGNISTDLKRDIFGEFLNTAKAVFAPDFGFSDKYIFIREL